jgi:hypothetical protein
MWYLQDNRRHASHVAITMRLVFSLKDLSVLFFYLNIKEMCQIVQDVGACLIQHTKGPGKRVRLHRMSAPVYSNTPRDQGNVSDCTGCQNLSNSTYKGTKEMCQIVQDVRTCLIQHTKGPGKCVGLDRF